jgi:hypothetical protein
VWVPLVFVYLAVSFPSVGDGEGDHLCGAVIVLDGESAGASCRKPVSRRNPRPILGGGCQFFHIELPLRALSRFFLNAFDTIRTQ